MATRVTVLNGNIVSVIQVGEVARWTRETAKDIERLARRKVKVDTGRLRDSHVTLPARGSNAYQKRYRISALAPYSLYRHQGTGIYGPRGVRIKYGFPKTAKAMIGGKEKFFLSQKGTKGDNWLERAALQVAAQI